MVKLDILSGFRHPCSFLCMLPSALDDVCVSPRLGSRKEGYCAGQEMSECLDESRGGGGWIWRVDG